MGHPCGYFLGTSFSKICNFNREFKTKSFRGRILDGYLSFVEALWQPFTRTNRSPQSPFLIVEMVYSLYIPTANENLTPTNEISDPLDIALTKYNSHQSVKLIKERVQVEHTLGAETFAGRKFREKKKSRNYGHKLSRMTSFPANFATKTFAIKMHFRVKKLSRLQKG